MRKFIAILGSVAVASIIPATPAFAEGSIVVNGDACGGFVPTVEGGIGASLLTYDSHQVTRGNRVTVTCHFDIPSGQEPPRGTKADGVPCSKDFDGDGVLSTTNDTRMSASPGGRAVGTCRWDLSVLGLTATTTKKKR